MRTAVATLTLLLTVAGAAPATAQTRSFAGGFSSRWNTHGLHGHDQECMNYRRISPIGEPMVLVPACNQMDFERGNLDNSIGFRAGRERDFWSAGPLRFVGGVEGSVNHTEYNLSQGNFSLISGAAAGGADLARWGGRLGFRYGLGPFVTTESRRGIYSFLEVAATLPLGSGSSLRISQRTTNHSHPYDGSVQLAWFSSHDAGAREVAVMLVRGTEAVANSRWSFATSTGVSIPGAGYGHNLKLGTAPFHRLSVFHNLRSPDTQAVLAWTSSAHESSMFTNYRGYEDNQRSKTIDAYAIGVRRNRSLRQNLSMQYGATIELADWRDNHNLLHNGERVIEAGLETAAGVTAGLRLDVGRLGKLEVTAEQLYWQAIGLGELRCSIGLVFNR